MSNNQSRRKLLKSIAAGSGAVVAGKTLPESWSKPVIDTVILPSHASTTDDSDSQGGAVTTPAPAPTKPPCDIAGEYCWLNRKSATNTVTTTFTVGSDGKISIHRVNTKNALVWEGSDFASNGSLGGDFDIIAYRTPEGTNRRYIGTIVCNSDSIIATEDGTEFTATKGACVTPD